MSVYFCIDLRWFELVEQAENGKMCKGCVCFNGEEFDQDLCNRLPMCCHARYSENHKDGYYVELSEEEMIKRSLPSDTVLFPPWAIGLLEGEDSYVLGAQLCTRDGRKTGNAVIVDVGVEGFEVLTDMGTTLRFNEAELKSLFHPPKYYMNLQEARQARVRRGLVVLSASVARLGASSSTRTSARLAIATPIRN